MTDWYRVWTGRPDPGRATRARRLRYLGGEEDHEVTAIAEGVEYARRAAREAYAGEPRPEWRNVRPRTPPGHVPFSAAAGVDDRPFGDDFMLWHNQVYGPRGRDVAPEQPPVRFAWGEDTATGAEPRYAPRDPIPAGYGREPPSAPRRLVTGRAGRQREVTMADDEAAAWHEAEARARARWESGAPSVTDMFFAAVFGDRNNAR